MISTTYLLQTRGFLAAELDPLGIVKAKKITNAAGLEMTGADKVLMQHSKYFESMYAKNSKISTKLYN